MGNSKAEVRPSATPVGADRMTKQKSGV